MVIGAKANRAAAFAVAKGGAADLGAGGNGRLSIATSARRGTGHRGAAASSMAAVT